MNRSFIALVEDNADDEALTMRALKKHGIANDIVVLRDGVEALAFLLAPDQPLPHLVLLDLNLPRVNGLEVLQRLRADPRTQLLPDRDPHILKRRTGPHRGVSIGRQQLRPQAGGLPAVLGRRASVGSLLAGAQSDAPALMPID